jgi:hypothetical protein
MNYIKPIEEFLNENFRGDLKDGNLYYHGTKKEELALSIIEDGFLMPGNDGSGGKSRFTPMVNKVYVAPSLEDVMPYVLGGNIAGIDNHFIETDGRYGYLFTIDLNEIDSNRILIDEDILGELMFGLTLEERYNKDNYFFPKGKISKGIGELDIEKFKTKKSYIYSQIRNKFFNILTENETRNLRILDLNYDKLAQIGKRLNKKLTDWQISYFVECFKTNYAIEGSVKIKEGYKFDKNNTSNLNRDYSNIFDYLERVY